MKKVVVAIVVFITIVLGVLLGLKPNYPPGTISSKEQKISPLTITSENVLDTSHVIIPVLISIPKLGINAQVEYVGLDQQGKMDVPKNYKNVAWFKLGYKPGEKGNSVIAGHLDTISGAPAVFFNIYSLNIGDEIIVKGEDGTELVYRVSEKRIYDFDKFPLEEVFGSRDNSRLNLITCDGVFNQNTSNYSQRVVIYSDQVA